MWRGKFEWNPGLIIAQIVAIQAAFYSAMGALLIFLVGEWKKVGREEGWIRFFLRERKKT